MCEATQERRGCISGVEYFGPFAEAGVGGEKEAGWFIEFAQQREQQCAVGCASSPAQPGHSPATLY